TLAELVGDADADRVLKLDLDAAGLLDKLSRGVPPPGRAVVLVPWSRALYRAGNAALDLGRVDESLPLHRKSLSIANELPTGPPPHAAGELNPERTPARLARALEKAKQFAEAREQCEHARIVFTAHRAAAQDPAGVDRLIAFVDRLLATISESEGGAQAGGKE